jgi:hypothetical protein
VKSFLSTKESLDREDIKYAKTEKVKDGFPEKPEEISAAKYHCVELMFYILIILRGKREDVKW